MVIPPMLGTQLFTIRAFTHLKRVAATGYPAIQISGFGPVAPQEVARLVEEAGLTVAATHRHECRHALGAFPARHR